VGGEISFFGPHGIMMSVLFLLLLLSRFACLSNITLSHVCVEAAEATSRFIFDGLSLVNFFDSQFPGKDVGGTSLKIKGTRSMPNDF